MAKTQFAGHKRRGAASQAVEKADPYFSRAVGKAFQALDRMSESAAPLTLAELTAALGLTKASTFRILRTLEVLGYVSKATDNRYALAGPHHPRTPVQLVSRMMETGAVPMEGLALKHQETVGMAAIFENRIEVVAVVESRQLIRMGNTVGRILPPHASALGKAITAFQTPEVRDRLLGAYGTLPLTAHTIAGEIALRKEFSRIRETGYAEDWQESTLGGCCFAAPILRPDGAAAGAISLSMPQLRFKGEEQQKEIVRAVRRTARTIQHGLFRK